MLKAQLLKLTCKSILMCGILWLAIGAFEFAQSQEEYRLGPEDVLKIQVYGEEDLAQEVVVSDDGTFPYPLIGIVKAEGLTAGEVKERK